jgi:hypothetical protein
MQTNDQCSQSMFDVRRSQPTFDDDVAIDPMQVDFPSHSSHRKTDEILMKKVKEIVTSYQLALNLTGSQAYPDLVGHFRIFDQQTGSICMLTKRTVMPIITKMTDEFHSFAMQQR